MGPEILVSMGLGLWGKVPKAFPDPQFCAGQISVSDFGIPESHLRAKMKLICWAAVTHSGRAKKIQKLQGGGSKASLFYVSRR